MDINQPDADVIVVGAGFAGLYALHRFANVDGLSVIAIEASDTVGGTWNWNRYPGARCDSVGYTYCYSFDRDLLQEWNWTEKFPAQAEILRYLEHVAARFDLKRHIRFSTTVTSANFDERNNLWKVGTSDGATVTARYLVTGVGHLSISPYVPEIEGIERFEGQWHHTSRWPREGVDLAGKRVGVIGTGSSGVQAIPTIAKDASHLTVFMRHPQYSVPARNGPLTQDFLDDIKRHYDEIWDICRRSPGGFHWQHNGRSALDDSAEKRQATFEKLWAEGGMLFKLASYKDLTTSPQANATVSEFVRGKIREAIDDPQTRASLVPDDHPFFSRRPVVDIDYFETYNRKNVSLVDLRESPIVRITAQGIETTAGEIELDVIVFATGFDAVTGPLFNLHARGRGGMRLEDMWANGPKAYLGIQTAGFPNMFMITGPASINGNLPLMVESHVDWISGCIRQIREKGFDTIEPATAAQTAWMDEMKAMHDRSIVGSTDSWANGGNIPGKARAPLLYFGNFGKYRERIFANLDDGLPGFALSGQPDVAVPAR